MSLKRKAAGGVKHVGAASVLVNLINVAKLVILARLLDPKDFGLLGMSDVVIGFASLLANVGGGTAVIQKQYLTSRVLSTLYWLSLATGVVVFLISFAASPLVAAYYREPRLTPVMMWMSGLFVINSVGMQMQALAEKALRFALIARIEVLSALFGLGVAVAMALLGFGVYALVGATLSAATVRALLMFVTNLNIWKPTLEFNYKEARDSFGMGVSFSFQRAINHITSNIDYLLVGRYLGAKELGYYSLAFMIANLPTSHINSVMSRVFFPLFAPHQNDIPRLRSGYLGFQKITSIVNTPILVALALLAPDLVPFVLGSEWQPVVVLLQLLCFVGLMRSIGSTVSPLILATGKARLGFNWSVVAVLIQVPGIYLGVQSGSARGVAIAFCVLTVLLLVIGYFMLIRQLIGPCATAYIGRILPFLIMGCAMAGVMYGVGAIIPESWTVVRMIMQLIAGIATYGVLIWWREWRLLMEMKEAALARSAA